MGKLITPLTIFSIYNKFVYLKEYAEMMCGNLKEECWFSDYLEFREGGTFYFKINNKYDAALYNYRVMIDKHEYIYYDELVRIFKFHTSWLFDISEYNHCMEKFYIIFKRTRRSGSVEIHAYDISGEGVILVNDDFSRKVADYIYNDTIRVYEAFKPLSDFTGFMRVPTLSKPPIFNPPATICYWTDGTKTVVKCQEGDVYSPEAGLALCYMKKVLGNTSKDLNKELHKYIPEECEKADMFGQNKKEE